MPVRSHCKRQFYVQQRHISESSGAIHQTLSAGGKTSLSSCCTYLTRAWCLYSIWRIVNQLNSASVAAQHYSSQTILLSYAHQVCTNVVQSCAGLFQPNCSAIFDYSDGAVSLFPRQYDRRNDLLMCNIVPAVFSIASTSEPYLQKGTGACAGLVTDVFIPPGNLVSPYFTYLTSPYMIQSLIESILVESFSQIPVSTSADCHFAFRKYFCGSFM